MARLNTRPSNLPSSRPQSARLSQSARQSLVYGTDTPAPGTTSDEENTDPHFREVLAKHAMGNLPTPSDTSENSSHSQKRKRVEVLPLAEHDAQEQAFNKYFDPNQDPDVRREVKRKSRLLEREFNETRDELLRNNDDGLRQTINKANRIYKNVKQTNDAISDSRLLVNVSDLANKKTAQLVLGDGSTGIDVDEFLSKFLSFGRKGNSAVDNESNTLSGARCHRRRWSEVSNGEEDNAATGSLDWDYAGRMACLPSIRRPPVPSFLLGPLSVEKKVRSQTQRKARAKDAAGREARPEALTRQDLQRTDENGLTAICSRIRNHLSSHCQRAEDKLQHAGFSSPEELDSEEGRKMMRKCHITATGGPSLFDYVVNPRSFGQTVENLFYVSFLIKEGAFGIQHDDDGLPTIVPSEASTLAEQRQNKTTKHQAVFAIDYATWHSLIQAFDIGESMIEHRTEEEPSTQVGQRGWYS